MLNFYAKNVSQDAFVSDTSVMRVWGVDKGISLSFPLNNFVI